VYGNATADSDLRQRVDMLLGSLPWHLATNVHGFSTECVGWSFGIVIHDGDDCIVCRLYMFNKLGGKRVKEERNRRRAKLGHDSQEDVDPFSARAGKIAFLCLGYCIEYPIGFSPSIWSFAKIAIGIIKPFIPCSLDMKSNSRKQLGSFQRFCGILNQALRIGLVLLLGCSDKPPKFSMNPVGATVQKPSDSVLPRNVVSMPDTGGGKIKRRNRHNTSPPADSAQLREEATRSVDELVQNLPRIPDALEMKARIHLLLGENDAAKQAWDEALIHVPTYVYAIYGLGGIALRSGDYDTAIALFKRAIPELPGNPDPSLDLAEAYTKLGRIDEAIAVLSASAKVNSTSATTFLQLGQAYLTNKKFEEAKSAFEAALTISAGLPRAQLGLGTALLRLGNRAEAEKLLRAQQSRRTAKNRLPEVVFLDEKNDISNRFELISRVYLEHGYPEKAEEILGRSLVLDPTNTNAGELLLKLYQSLKLQSDSIDASKRLCDMAPGNPAYQYTHGRLLQQNAEPALAAEAFQRVVELAPEDPLGYEALVRILITMQKQLDRALEVAKQLVKLRGNAMDNELLGQAYAVNGDLHQAKLHLEIAIKLDPENQGYLTAMKYLTKAIRELNE